MTASVQNALSSLTGNIPKAVLCVRQVTADDTLEDTAGDAKALQERLLAAAKKVLDSSEKRSSGAVPTFSSLTEGGIMAGLGYVAMEVQYNPNTIHMETQAGQQVQYSGGNLGSGSMNQITQVHQPVSTTISFQLIFDDMNPSDAFMLENLSATVGNAVSGISSMARKLEGRNYSVQKQIDGLMSLLTQDTTRQVIFFWARMCFRGEITKVDTTYTMFNKDGNPIRGVVDMTIRQGNESEFAYDETYWDKAFTNAFGEAGESVEKGIKDRFTQVTNNNFLNLNL